MNLTIPPGMSIRPNADDLDFADLAPGCARTGPAAWLEDGTLSLPFDPEPTQAQQQQIRRRLLTRDSSQERITTGLASVYSKLDPNVPLQLAARLLIEDRIGRVEGW